MKRHWAILTVLMLALAAFAPVVRFGFLDWDDVDLVAENPLLMHPDAAALKNFWTRPQLGLYTPAAYSLWWIAAKCGLRAQGFHILNLLLHLLAVFAVYLLLLQLTDDGNSRMAAALGAAVFALHPLQVEAVAWISGMNNILAALFGIAAIACYLRSISRKSRRTFWLATGFFALALLSKPMAVVIPLVAMLLDWGMKGRSPRKAIGGLWLWCVMALAISVVTHAVQPASSVSRIGPMSRLLVAVDSLGFYLAKLFVPVNLTVDYGRTPGMVAALGWTWPAMLALAAAAVALFLPRRWMAMIAIFIAATLPTLGLIAFDFQRYSTVADRYVYLAMLAPAAVAWASGRRWPAITAMAAILVILLLAASEMQLQYWQNDSTLFKHNLAINPQSLAADQVLGFAAVRAGNHPMAMRYDLAGLEHHPTDPILNFAVGNLLLSVDPAAAAQRYEIAIQGRPGEAKIRNNYGVALARLGRSAEAAQAFRIAIELAPGWQDPVDNLRKTIATQPRD